MLKFRFREIILVTDDTVSERAWATKATRPRNGVTPGGTIRIDFKDGANVRVGNCWHIIQWTIGITTRESM